MIVGDTPAGGVVLERLGNMSAAVVLVNTETRTYRVQKRAKERQHYLLVWTSGNVRDGLNALHREDI